MKKISEVVRETQSVEEQFEEIAPWLLERLAKADSTHDDTSLIKLYAHSVLALGRNCDEVVASAE